MTVPDVIERRECPECGREDISLGRGFYHVTDGERCPGGEPVSRRYVAVDALLRDDVVEIFAEEFARGHGSEWPVERMGQDPETGAPIYPEEIAEIYRDMARAALAAAVKHLTGNTTEETR
jgi:hypothetical protein